MQSVWGSPLDKTEDLRDRAHRAPKGQRSVIRGSSERQGVRWGEGAESTGKDARNKLNVSVTPSRIIIREGKSS